MTNQNKKTSTSASNGSPYFDFRKTLGYLVIGCRGSGKSVVVENLGERYYAEGHVVFDAFGASDFENCFWVVEGEQWYPSIFIVPEYVDYKLPHPYDERVTVMRDTDGLKKILKEATKTKPPKVVVFVNSTYADEHMLEVLAGFFNEIVEVNNRMDLDIFLLIRELSHLAGSNLKLFENAVHTKRALMKLLTVCRHHKIGYAIDSQILTMVYKNIRTLTDRYIVKRSTKNMIPEELGFLLAEIKRRHDKYRGTKHYRRMYASYPHLHRLTPNAGYFLRNGSEYVPPQQCLSMPSFRHKRGRDNFFKLTGMDFVKNKAELIRLGYSGDKADRIMLSVYNNLINDFGFSKRKVAKVFGYSSDGGLHYFLNKLGQK